MIYGMYAIYDKLVGYQSPTAMPNDSFSMRAFSESFSDCQNPQDYILYKVGEFNLETGELKSIPPLQICCATDIVKGDDKQCVR